MKILVGRSSGPSARMIRDAIETITGKHYLVTTDPNTIRDRVLFRYGNAKEITEEKDTKINSKLFITLAGNKLNFSSFAKENDLYSPVYNQGVPQEFPVVVRSTLRGYGGVGITFCSNLEEFNAVMTPTSYWTPFVKCQFELRVHLFGTEVNRIYKKEPVHEEPEYPIRNSDHEYHYSLKNKDNYPKVVELCNKLGSLLQPWGGYFSGVDLGWDAVNKKYFIFEINSAPGLSSVNAMEYAKYILSVLQEG